MKKLKSALLLMVISNIVIFCLTLNREGFNTSTEDSNIRKREVFSTTIDLRNFTKSHLEWKFITPPELNDGSDGKLLTEELGIPLWDVSAFENPSFPKPKFNKAKKYTLIILVNSAVGHFGFRSKIRETWGKSKTLGYLTFFAVGKSWDKSLNDLVYRESKFYGDIILGDFHDHYVNNTMKTILSLQMALKMFKFRFLLKTDDDVLVNPPAIVGNLKTLDEKIPIYAGSSVRLPEFKKIPRPDNCTEEYNCKWAISRSVWPFDYNVDFARGLAAIFSRASIEILLKGYKYVPYTYTDDVYIGYVLKRNSVKFCEIGKEHIKDKKNYYPYSDVCQFAEVYAMHFRSHWWHTYISDQVMKSWTGCIKKRKTMLELIKTCYSDFQVEK